MEARVALPDSGEEPERVATPTRRFTVMEIPSGLPDDSRKENERREEHYLRDVRARVKLARAVVSRMPGLDAILRERPDRSARFYARFGITEATFRYGVPGFPEPDFWEGVPGWRGLLAGRVTGNLLAGGKGPGPFDRCRPVNPFDSSCTSFRP